MPFNGDGQNYSGINWNYLRIIDTVKAIFPLMQKINDAAFSTSYNYHIPGHKGNVGVIAAYTRSFCGTCNRLRITPKGVLKTCLYDDGVLNIKDKMREGQSDNELETFLLGAIGSRVINGWEAEKQRVPGNLVHESMTTIGG
jgi:cyclic pyranopterin phosphate synthase